MSYNCRTVSCVLRRTILLNQIRAKVAHITKLEVTIARELLPYDLHLDYINYLLITKRTHRCEHCPNFASFELF